ncbi:type II toxin-antitoxin system PemK/MazF family toxin [Winslowiella toletana]|uniref:type II toxin-antitoxin system PemK/MazF family toxin n=1 Tax=Winslowiella toletana TaxID=92490 RepID=UPI0004777DCE|nr:type II toxin-antitoxin system PemK/MazF family toxin [Winslowiella toletana]
MNFSPKVGEILECNFGNYLVGNDGQIVTNFYDGHLPPEMVKNRLVVVLNGKLNGNACIVVPLSTTHDREKCNRGMHVEISEEVIEMLRFFSQQTRWAKADLMQQVSRSRLNRARTDRGYLNQCLPREIVAEIQRAVIKSINAAWLIK